MIISDQQREENFQEYQRLLHNPEYKDVTFDELSGGVSAVHIKHKFDHEFGAFGIRIGDYEKNVINALRKRGHNITLESEIAPNGIKTPDGCIDGLVMDIKSTDGNGKWAIKDKIHSAVKQGVECVILYFHRRHLFSWERINDGWDKFLNDHASEKYPTKIKRVICVVESDVMEYDIPK